MTKTIRFNGRPDDKMRDALILDLTAWKPKETRELDNATAKAVLDHNRGLDYELFSDVTKSTTTKTADAPKPAATTTPAPAPAAPAGKE